MNGVQQNQMTSALEQRRARVRELIAQGRVMNDSRLRRRNKKEAERQNKLEQMADNILVGITGVPTSNRTVMGSTAPVVKKQAPEANVFLNSKVKQDKLAVAAAKIIQELQNA